MATLEALRESTTDGSLPAFVWPGGYPMLYITVEGLIVCPDCANKADVSDPVRDGDVHWEGDPEVCEDCGKLVQPAYPED